MRAKTTQLASIVALAVGAVVALPMSVPATINCPDGMARIGESFCIDRYEASLLEVAESQPTQVWSPYHSPDRANVRAVSRRNAVPQGYVSAQQAQRACRASGKRLCRSEEWVRACQGPRRTVFPYGNARQAGRCNENHARHPVVQLYGRMGGYIWDGVHMNDPQINQMPGTLALTGAFEGCSNEYGVFDMVGNLHEWVADSEGTFRGGYYMDTRMNGDGCRYSTRAHDVAYHDYSTGFRCCADLPDGT